MNTNTKEYSESILKTIEEGLNESMTKLASTNDQSIKSRISALKLIKSELIRENGKHYPNTEYKLNQTQETALLLKMKCAHEETMSGYEKVNNTAAYEQEKGELDVLLEYLPKQPTEDEIIAYTKEVIDEYLAEKEEGYVVSPRDMGKIMPKVKVKFPNVDGNIVKKVLLTANC